MTRTTRLLVGRSVIISQKGANLHCHIHRSSCSLSICQHNLVFVLPENLSVQPPVGGASLRRVSSPDPHHLHPAPSTTSNVVVGCSTCNYRRIYTQVNIDKSCKSKEKTEIGVMYIVYIQRGLFRNDFLLCK